MSDLMQRILSEAAIAGRPGSLLRLETIAADIAALERERDAAKSRARGAMSDYGEQYRRADEAEARAESAERRIAAVEALLADYIDALNRDVTEAGEFGYGVHAAFDQAAMHIRDGSWKTVSALQPVAETTGNGATNG